MQIDSALQAMIDKSKQKMSGQTGPSYDMGTSVDIDLSSQPMGSNEFACGVAAPFPDSTEDVSMESGVDKKTIPEAKYLMWEVHQRMPAWKANKLIEPNKNDQVDLAALGEATGILFDSREMLSEAIQCLQRIRKEKDAKEDDKSGSAPILRPTLSTR